MRSAAPVAAVLAALLMTSSCGDVSRPDPTRRSPTPVMRRAALRPLTPVDTSAAEGDWLLGMQTAGGADAETSATAYVTYNPVDRTGARPQDARGQGRQRRRREQAALLVSADRRWAIPDTEIPRAEENSGELKVYSLTSTAPRSSTSARAPATTASRPSAGPSTRSVPTRCASSTPTNRVWAVKRLRRQGHRGEPLPKGPWVFTNGFNRNTGEPYVGEHRQRRDQPGRQRSPPTPRRSPVTAAPSWPTTPRA